MLPEEFPLQVALHYPTPPLAQSPGWEWGPRWRNPADGEAGQGTRGWQVNGELFPLPGATSYPEPPASPTSR